MHHARHLGAALLAALTLTAAVAVYTAPAGAQTIQSVPWHGGRAKTNFYGGAGVCTSGPTFISTTTGHRYQAMPHHCFASAGMCGNPFMSVYEGDFANNRHDCWSVIQPPAPWASYDVALVDLGAATSSNNSRAVFDYCVSGNCSAYYGGGTAVNCNWCGSWWTITGESAPSPGTGTVWKSGAIGGSSVTGIDAQCPFSYSFGLTSYSYWGWCAYGASGCGLAAGDSGSPLIIDAGSHNARVVGMVTASITAPAYAGPGNSCYTQGTPYYNAMGFIAANQIETIFSAYSIHVN